MELTEIQGVFSVEVLPFIGGIKSLSRLILGDHMLRLGRRQRLAVLHRRLPRSKEVFFEKALADKFFQIFSKASAVDSLVFYCHGNNIILLLWGVWGCIGLALGALPTTGP